MQKYKGFTIRPITIKERISNDLMLHFSSNQRDRYKFYVYFYTDKNRASSKRVMYSPSIEGVKRYLDENEGAIYPEL